LESLWIAILNSSSKNALSSLLCFCLFFNIVIRAEQDLPGSEEGRERRVGKRGRVEK
jgi:hypothetical protein